jgi:hypothetical protein
MLSLSEVCGPGEGRRQHTKLAEQAADHGRLITVADMEAQRAELESLKVRVTALEASATHARSKHRWALC